MSKELDLTGKRFGKLVAIQIDKNPNTKRRKWMCLCDCGNSVSVATNHLTSGQTISCGCRRYETKNQTHGMKQTRLYGIWCGMKKRCNNPNDHNYKNYGARGIKVCAEWEKDFVAFNCWALLNGYSDDLTIDRKDNNGDYCPQNCRWVTHSEQQSNRSNNVYMTINGETKTIAKWCKELNFPEKKAYQRFHRAEISGREIKPEEIFADDLVKRKVEQYTLDRVFIKKWESAAEAGHNGFSRSAITQCCSGKLKRSKGYIWRYAEE